MTKPKDQVVGLKTLTLRSTAYISTNQRPHKKRVFTDDQLTFLKSKSINDLEERIKKGRLIIRLLDNPAMLNMTPKSANYISSNLEFQIDVISEIIRQKKEKKER